MRRVNWGGFGLLLVLAAGCRSQEAREFEAEVAGIARQIEVVRDADNAGKGAALEGLKTAACRDERACELKTKCIRAYMQHVAALELSQQAAALVAMAEKDATAQLAAAATVADAEEKLNAAKPLTEQCASAQGELVRASRAAR